MGFSLSTGRGATAAALVRRALRRRDLRPGWRLSVSDWFELIADLSGRRNAEKLLRRKCVPGRNGCGHDVANPCGSLGDVSMRLQ